MAVPAMNKKDDGICVKKAKPTKSKVSFADVQVRMYPVTLGHNPGGVEGPPLSLSWNYTSIGRATVDDFEKHRKDPNFRRRDLQHLHIPPGRRVGLLRKAGFSDKQIHQASQEAAVERRARRLSFQDAIMKCRAKKAAERAAGAEATTPTPKRPTKQHC
eukprot:scaffold6761_cov159-Amphora_coffeaeformis.AAC.3